MLRFQRHWMSCAMTALAMAVAAAAPAEAQWFRRFVNAFRPPPVPPPIPADKAEEVDEPDDGTRSLVLPDNGDLRRKLELVKKQIAGEHYSEAARQLAQFLQDPTVRDFFLHRDEDRRGGRGFQAEVQRLLRELPPEGLAAYRVQYEPVARTQLNAALARGDEAALRAVALQFPETKAGDEALFRLAQYLWDHNRIRAAAATLQRLHMRSAASGALEPGVSLLAAACWARLGDRDRARGALALLRGPSRDLPLPPDLQIAGVRSRDLVSEQGLDEFLDRVASDGSAANRRLADWPTFHGDATRARTVAAKAPFLLPRWSVPASSDPQTQLAINRAAEHYAQGIGTSLPLLNPLAVGNLVLVRSSRGIAAFDLETGRCRWRHPSDDDGDNPGLDRILWQEPGGGAFSADDECVYLLDDPLPGDAEAVARVRNTLSAREHYRSREGNLRWRVGGLDGGSESRLAGAFFLGPPLASHGRVYVLAELAGAVSLVVLDRAQGRLEWSQDLALVEEAVSSDLLRMVGGATLSISDDEIIVCPTSGGVIVAVDLTTQSLLWAYRYARHVQGQPAAATDELEAVPRLDQFDRWLDATASIAGEYVLCTPADSREIHCMDLHTGEPRWTQPRGDGMFVACTTQEIVLVVGRRQVVARRVTDGAAAWTRVLPEPAFPSGRGVCSGARYFLPATTAAVLEIDLATGALADVHQSPRQLSAGNLIWHRGLFISQGPAALEVFDEREDLVTRIRQQLEQDPLDPAALVRHGEMELAAGRIAESIAAFHAAHQAAPSPRTKSKLVSALLEGVRRNLPEKEALSTELDELIGP